MALGTKSRVLGGPQKHLGLGVPVLQHDLRPPGTMGWVGVWPSGLQAFQSSCWGAMTFQGLQGKWPLGTVDVAEFPPHAGPRRTLSTCVLEQAQTLETKRAVRGGGGDWTRWSSQSQGALWPLQMSRSPVTQEGWQASQQPGRCHMVWVGFLSSCYAQSSLQGTAGH